MNKHLKIALLVIVFAALTSCKKTTNNQNATEAQRIEMKKIAAVAGGMPRFPTLENGMLVFDNEKHFEDYIAFLDAAVDPRNYDSTTLKTQEFDQDEILGNIEAYMGFTSIRKISHDKFMELNETGWERLEDIPDEHFISDLVLRSTLNENLTVKIGVNYVHVINKALTVQVDASQDELLEAFNELPVTATFQDVLHIDPKHQHSTLFETMGSGGIISFGKIKQTLAEGDLFVTGMAHDAPDCNNPKKIVFHNLQLWQEIATGPPSAGSLPATFTIDFGDGTALKTIHSEPFAGIHIVPAFDHPYAALGNYTVKVHAVADYTNPGATSTTADINYPITVTGGFCKEIEKQHYEIFPVPDGSRAVGGKIEVALLKPFIFGSEKTRIISKTTSRLKNGNLWQESKAEIWGNLHTNRMDNDCNVTGQVDGDGWASKAGSITVHRTDARYPWYFVTSNHGIKYHNTWYIHPKSLSICN
jgi:hypothetical protein